MLDPKILREDPERIKAAARLKRIDVDVDSLVELDDRRRALIVETDAARGEQNAASKSIGSLPPDPRAAAAAQVKELEETLNATPAQAVLAATPIDLTRLMTLNKPIVRVRYELVESDPPAMRRKIEHAVARRLEGLPAGSGDERVPV